MRSKSANASRTLAFLLRPLRLRTSTVNGFTRDFMERARLSDLTIRFKLKRLVLKRGASDRNLSGLHRFWNFTLEAHL